MLLRRSVAVVVTVFVLIHLPGSAVVATADPTVENNNTNMMSFESAGVVPQILARAPAHLLEVGILN